MLPLRINWYHVIIVVVVAAEMQLKTLSDCVGCQNDAQPQPELNEFLKTQKKAHRLEYIKQQLINNLHVENRPKEPPKFDSLPEFLVRELVHASDTTSSKLNSGAVPDGNEDQTSKQMLLFAEQEIDDCYTNGRPSLCLEFKLSEEILSADISAVSIWFHKNFVSFNDNETQHTFTVVDKTASNVKNRYGRNANSYRTEDKNGWFEIDVTALVKSWQFNNKKYKHGTMAVICDTCKNIRQISRSSIIKNSGDAKSNDTNVVGINKTSFLLFNTENDQNSRSKRGLECVPGRDECCREDLFVDFNTLGDEYKMILTPTKFNAYVCRGSCYLHSATDAHKPYATLLLMLKSRKENENEYSLPTTCCTPTKFSSLQVLYASDNLTIKKTSIPNIIVESCGCI